MKTTIDAMKPCPCCGGDAYITNGYAVENVWVHGAFHRVFCGSCQLRQLFYKTPDEAIAAWNKREEAQTVEPAGIVEKNESGQIRIVWRNGTDVSCFVGESLFTHPAPPPSGERAKLIEWQHDRMEKYTSQGYDGLADLAKKSADMLAADAQANETDSLLIFLGLDPDTYRTDGGWLNLAKIKAALKEPEMYPHIESPEMNPVAWRKNHKGIIDKRHSYTDDPKAVAQWAELGVILEPLYTAEIVAFARAVLAADTHRCEEAKTEEIKFLACEFEGSPPKPYPDWNSWANARPMMGVSIRASQPPQAEPVGPIEGVHYRMDGSTAIPIYTSFDSAPPAPQARELSDAEIEDLMLPLMDEDGRVKMIAFAHAVLAARDKS